MGTQRCAALQLLDEERTETAADVLQDEAALAHSTRHKHGFSKEAKRAEHGST